MIMARRAFFFIRVHAKEGDYLEEKLGYIFEYGGIRFGADYRNRKWVITELSTGLRIDGTPIRSKNGIEGYMKERIERIQKIANSETAEGWRRMFRELSEKEN